METTAIAAAAAEEFERIVRMWRLAAAEFGIMETVAAVE